MSMGKKQSVFSTGDQE